MMVFDREAKVSIVYFGHHSLYNTGFCILLFILFQLYVVNVKQILRKQLVDDHRPRAVFVKFLHFQCIERCMIF